MYSRINLLLKRFKVVRSLPKVCFSDGSNVLKSKAVLPETPAPQNVAGVNAAQPKDFLSKDPETKIKDINGENIKPIDVNPWPQDWKETNGKDLQKFQAVEAARAVGGNETIKNDDDGLSK